jgi:hypothetical protein
VRGFPVSLRCAVAVGCSSSGSGGPGGSGGGIGCPDDIEVTGGAPENPFLANSIYAIPHGEAQELTEAWANPDLSSPNSVPYVSRGTGLIHTIGARDGRWTFHYVLGGAQYNSLFSGVHLDPRGGSSMVTPSGRLAWTPTEKPSHFKYLV